jgi:hypothetical protein
MSICKPQTPQVVTQLSYRVSYPYMLRMPVYRELAGNCRTAI